MRAAGLLKCSAVSITVAAAVLFCGCETAEPPPHWEIVELRGTAYERGFEHGRRFSSKVRSLYTQLLATSIMPYLNRERATICTQLWEYEDPRYDDGQFSYLVFLESGQNLEQYIPQRYIDEMHGVADGAGIEYEKVLILNTFMDTLVAFRALTYFIRDMASPSVEAVEFSGADLDGADNTGDGTPDEENEHIVDPFEPSRFASLVEVPLDTVIKIRLRDDEEGVNPDSIRIQLIDDEVYTVEDPAVDCTVYGEEDEGLEVTFDRPGGWEAGRFHSIIISAGDNALVEDPPPVKANNMRDVRIGFTTAGYGEVPWDVRNRGFDDGRSQPPSFGFAVRGSATPDDTVRLGHHFALLDSNTSHKHSALFVHHPESGYPYVVPGWTGAIFGFSGMNSEGLTYAANPCDTLDNPIAKEFKKNLIAAKLLSSGIPMGLLGRELLSRFATVDEAAGWLRDQPFTYGWCVLLADADQNMAMVEADSNILEDATSFHVWTPDPADPKGLDSWGRPLASVAEDDLRMAIHWNRNRPDIDFELYNYHVKPHRYWSSYYFRSLRSFYLLGDIIAERYGEIDLGAAQQMLGIEALVDQRDSMNAVVFEPELMKVHFAMGQVPATSGPFIELDFGSCLASGSCE